jgi:hypothetical protein
MRTDRKMGGAAATCRASALFYAFILRCRPSTSLSSTSASLAPSRRSPRRPRLSFTHAAALSPPHLATPLAAATSDLELDPCASSAPVRQPLESLDTRRKSAVLSNLSGALRTCAAEARALPAHLRSLGVARLLLLRRRASQDGLELESCRASPLGAAMLEARNVGRATPAALASGVSCAGLRWPMRYRVAVTC